MFEKRKTIKELIESCVTISSENELLKAEIEKLCLDIRENTLKEAASNADADYYISGNSDDESRISEYDLEAIEVYVINSSILNLPKESIQIFDNSHT